MSNDAGGEIAAALGAYRAELARATPSGQLDARIAAAIHRPTGTGGAFRWRRWAIAAVAAIGVITVVLAGLTLRDARNEQTADGVGRAPAPVAAAAERGDTFAVAPTGSYSLWPTDGAVFRVRTRLDAASAALSYAGAGDERQYWVDVRVANDGSMRIVRIIPADSHQ